jgi:2,5-diketo-D-gluconate reductase A
MEQILGSGKARTIGVSNFKPHHLDDVLAVASVTPAINQIEYHPYFQQTASQQYNTEHGIVTESWSPLGQGDLADAPVVRAAADKYGKTVAQVILRWHIEIGHVVIPKSNRKERMAENFDLFDFTLTDDETAAITALNKGDAGRKGSDPDTATF